VRSDNAKRGRALIGGDHGDLTTSGVRAASAHVRAGRRERSYSSGATVWRAELGRQCLGLTRRRTGLGATSSPGLRRPYFGPAHRDKAAVICHGVAMTQIHLSFKDDDHRETILFRLRRYTPELVEDDNGAWLSFATEDPRAAWATGRVRVRAALRGTGIEPDGVFLSPDERRVQFSRSVVPASRRQ
jgi:hypothetical protein